MSLSQISGLRVHKSPSMSSHAMTAGSASLRPCKRCIRRKSCGRRMTPCPRSTAACAARLPVPVVPVSSQPTCHRRQILGLLGLLGAGPAHLVSASPAAFAPGDIVPADIRGLAPDPRSFDATDARLLASSDIFQRALATNDVREEERAWTELFQYVQPLLVKGGPPWATDVAARALGNRGNARARQGRLEQSLGDYNQAIELAPYAIDPVLNRGVALENLLRFDEAARDYLAVLRAAPEDPAGWNNLGNVRLAQGRYPESVTAYSRAVALGSVGYSFASANLAVAEFAAGDREGAIRRMRSLLRRYPEYPDPRAALAAALYAQGDTAEAEDAWSRVDDSRYRNRSWVRNTRRWPPALSDALEAFLDLSPAAPRS